MNEPRNSLRSQVGYLTARIEDMKVEMAGLAKFVKDHMDKEEKKFCTIDTRFEKQYRWMLGLTFIIMADSAGFPIEKIIQFLIKLT